VFSEDAKTVEPRRAMVERLKNEGITDRRVLDAMMAVPRHLFIPEDKRQYGYDPNPVPIGYGQTISSPFIVGSMTSLLEIRPGDKILEIGTGCGYQTAVLCELGAKVVTIELLPEVMQMASANLAGLGCDVKFKTGDGYNGWPEEALFDGCIVAATAPRIPEPLVEQLATGGRIVIPVREGPGVEMLIRGTRESTGLRIERLYQVIFVPMKGIIENQQAKEN